MPDFQTMREENEGVLYLLLTPFRWAVAIVKVAAVIVLGIIIFTYNQLGWIVGLGHMGYLSRKATADIMVGIPHPLSSSIAPDRSEVFTIDLSAREEMARPDSLSTENVAWVAIDPLPYALLGAIHPPDYCSDQVRREDPARG